MASFLRSAVDLSPMCGVPQESGKRVFVFLCNSRTRDEVFNRNLVGTTPEVWRNEFDAARAQDFALIFDFSAGELLGPFQITETGLALEPFAWSGRFSAQARFELAGSKQHTAPLRSVIATVPNFMRVGGTQPCPVFRGEAARRLLALFGVLDHAMPKPPPPAPSPSSAEPSLYRTPQGFMVQSKAERAIADFLFRNEIECSYDQPLPQGSSFRYDFYLPRNEVYIEYWGKPDDPQYRQRMEEKKLVYREGGLRLIEVFPQDERELESTLWRELWKFSVGPIRSDPKSMSFMAWLRRMIDKLFGR